MSSFSITASLACVAARSIGDAAGNGLSPWSQSLSSAATSTGAQAMNQLSWFSRNNKHRLKLTSELRYDGIAQDQTSNLLGTFTFNSLADLSAGRPAQPRVLRRRLDSNEHSQSRWRSPGQMWAQSPWGCRHR